MAYSIINQEINDTLKEPMFFGDSVNVARFDQQKFEMFEKLTEKQLSFFGDRKRLMYQKIKLILVNYCQMKNIYSFQIFNIKSY